MAGKMNKWTRFSSLFIVDLLTLVIIATDSPRCFDGEIIAHFSAYSPVLRFQGDNLLFDIAFWWQRKGVSARQLTAVSAGRTLDAIPSGGDGNSAPRSDGTFLATSPSPEGAP